MFRLIRKNRRRKIAVGTVVAAVAAFSLVGAAVAYYGGSGSGSAQASAGHAPRPVAVTGEAIDVIYPGEVIPVDLVVTLTGNGNGNARVGAVALDTTQGTNGISGLPVGCDRAWFSFTGPPANQFPAGANVTQATPLEGLSGSLEFLESGTLQDACSDAELELHLVASPN